MKLSLAQMDRLQRAYVASVVLLSLVLGLHALYVSPDVPYISQGGDASWIAAPVPVATNLVAVDLSHVPATVFVRRFGVGATGGEAWLEGRALRELSLQINGEPLVVGPPTSNWKRSFRVDVGHRLRVGRNELRAEVRNPRGPALLQLSLVVGGDEIRTDEAWQVSVGGANPVAAVRADDTRTLPESHTLRETGQILRERAGSVALLFGLCLAAWLAATRGQVRAPHPKLPQLALGLVTLFWITVFAMKSVRLPVVMGFDAPAHVLYIDLIRERHSLPLANEGWSTYHPPLHYLLTAGLASLFGVARDSAAGQIVYRLPVFAAGLANVWLTFGLARRLWPRDPLRTALAVAVAGLLPMNVYMSAYVSNEPLHAAWVSLGLLLAGRLLLGPGTSRAGLVGLAGVLGLALLTKFTSLLVAPLVAGFVAAKVWLVDAAPVRRSAGVLAGLLGGATAVSGWFYLRNWLVFGDAFVWNLDVPGAPTWWLQPGFHSAAWYGSFGEALRHPYFAGFHSFWDGVYSTFWGDGLVSGMVRIATRHSAWNWDYMTLGYWLALPASVLFAAGWLRMLRESFEEEDAGRRLLLVLLTSLVYLLGFSLLSISLRLPFYAQAKASYVLAAVLPLSLVAAEGLALPVGWLANGRTIVVRALYWSWLGTLASVIVLSFIG